MENTLYPVALVLETGRGLANTARIWGVVLGANIVGAVAFAALATRLDGVDGGVRGELTRLGASAAYHPYGTVFAGAIFGGRLIALVARRVQGRPPAR